MNAKLVIFGSFLGLALFLYMMTNLFWTNSFAGNIREDVLQEVLGFSQKEMVLFYSALLDLKAANYNGMDTCKTRTRCAQRAFTRLLARLHNSNILPMANRWWSNGSFERNWIEKFLIENALPLVRPRSTCLEWGTFYMEKIFKNACTVKDSLEHSDTPKPPQNSSIGTVFHDEIYKASTIPDNSYDVIISTQVYEHLVDPMLATRTMVRLLKPGGILIATGPHLCPFHRAPDDFFRYTHHGIASIMSRSGLTPVVERQFGNVMMLVNVFEGVPVAEVSDEDIFSKQDDAYVQWTIIARKPV